VSFACPEYVLVFKLIEGVEEQFDIAKIHEHFPSNFTNITFREIFEKIHENQIFFIGHVFDFVLHGPIVG